MVNLILNPIKTHFDPIGSVLQDSQIEDRLDSMFKSEVFGEHNGVCDEDCSQIEKFKSKIEYDGKNYFVELPWKNCVVDVNSNYNLCVKVLEKVMEFLKRSNLVRDYNEILQQQLKEGIIEEIDLSKVNLKDLKFIPHRPVLKSDRSTTKVRIVLNCSVKTKNTPSLNESAFPGIDLTGNLFELLLKIRKNKFLVMSDIKQAYLMIKLKNDGDKNKFVILWEKDGKLIAYRYLTIVFGFISSAFILNYVIKFHVSKFPDGLVSQILLNNLYVDNLFFFGK